MKKKPTLNGLLPEIADDLVTVRKLTPIEYWRLMDFSDDDFYRAQAALNKQFYGGKDRSASQLYKQAGNSIVVSVIGRDLAHLAGVEWPTKEE